MSYMMPVGARIKNPAIARLFNGKMFIKLNSHQSTEKDRKGQNRKYPEARKPCYDDDGHHEVKPEHQGFDGEI